VAAGLIAASMTIGCTTTERTTVRRERETVTPQQPRIIQEETTIRREPAPLQEERIIREKRTTETIETD
jgi:hypothetical protein